MSVPHTILGVLMDAPAHGYSIKKTLEARFPRDVRINDGRLYPALAKLCERGWIEKEVVEQPGPNKHLYRATEAGRRAFYEWLGSDRDEEPAANFDFFWRHDFLQKCTFFGHLAPEVVAAQVVTKRNQAQRNQAKLERALAEVDRNLDPYQHMVLEYGIRYQRMRGEWLESLLARAEDAVSPEDAVVATAR